MQSVGAAESCMPAPASVLTVTLVTGGRYSKHQQEDQGTLVSPIPTSRRESVVDRICDERSRVGSTTAWRLV
jgi:hypothetical protein